MPTQKNANKKNLEEIDILRTRLIKRALRKFECLLLRNEIDVTNDGFVVSS